MKRLIIIALLFFSAGWCFAENSQLLTVPSDSVKFPNERYSISLMGMYGYNYTWHSYGGIDINGHMPINQHFEMDAALEIHSASVCALTVVARPKFPIKKGEFFLDGSIHSRIFWGYKTTMLSFSGSFGYRMDYVSVQIGLLSNFIMDMELDYRTNNSHVYEPFNILYRLAVNVRPQRSCWNLQIAVANYTDYEYERTWLPIFMLRGNYNFLNHFSAILDIDFKSAGKFHLNNQFWGVNVRTGIKYMF
ncbi:MAG: hypothetical protein MJZ72_06680 [Bacteroidales bacterium]|nr:hypothetical protein [Bacteroidales bacterium]